MKKYLLLLLCVVLLSACGQTGGKGEVVAKIDGQAITTGDVEKEIKAMPPPYREFLKQPEAMNSFIDGVVNAELLVVAAKKKGIDKDEEYVKAVEDFKRNQLISRLLKKDMANVQQPQLTEKDVKDFYEAHKSELVQVTAVRISQIVVKTTDDAKKAYDRLQKGEAFNKVASELSIDKATAKAGGDMGFLGTNQLNNEIGKEIATLKKGQVSANPVPLKGNLHIFVITDVKSNALPFDKIKGGIAQQVMAAKQKDVIDKYLEGLKKDHKVEIIKENFAKINLNPAPAETPAKPAAAEKAPEKSAEKAPEKAPEKK